ncbi:MAG TPA: DUF4239 domain-containing protein [Planctomycetota bacterium]|nr:DUF4239 domain-containing protein [Planctomycetota bacterium]
MPFVLQNLAVSCGMFLGTLAMIRAGFHYARRRLQAADADGASVNSVDAAVYALLGLLIAFTFAGAAERFNGRRALVVEEANAIGTAYLRLDLLPGQVQPALRDRFRRYLDARLETHTQIASSSAGRAANDQAQKLQGEIWAEARAGSVAASQPSCAMLLLPALNSMFDIAATRVAVHELHPPMTIYGMIIGLTWVSGLLLGHTLAGMKGRHRLHGVIYSAVIAATFFVIMDIEHPREGLIRVDRDDAVLHTVRDSMK